MKLDFFDILFPKFCLNCNKEGSYLCEDCLFLIDINNLTFRPEKHFLDGLYSAVPYDNFIIQKIIKQFKYEPFVKDLAKVLSYFILVHFINLKKELSDFKDFSIIPVPLHIKRHKWRGFNQAEEIAKEISQALKIPVLNNVLFKTKQTLFQAELEKNERIENLKEVFKIKNEAQLQIAGKKILLVDDVYTTGSTMDECAKILKQNSATSVWGAVVARG